MASKGSIAARAGLARGRMAAAVQRIADATGVAPPPERPSVPIRQPELQAAFALESVAGFLEQLADALSVRRDGGNIPNDRPIRPHEPVSESPPPGDADSHSGAPAAEGHQPPAEGENTPHGANGGQGGPSEEEGVGPEQPDAPRRRGRPPKAK